MTTNNRIRVSDLDYLDIRENLKEFLKGQSQFSDYNFEGSALSVILDVLAYNTHYNAIYTNLAINEMYMDSASKRSSVVSIANNFAYTPVSAKASKAIVDVRVNAPTSTADFVTLPRFSSFVSTVDGVSYNYYTTSSYRADLNVGEYLFENVEVYEGTPQTFLFVCTQELEKFVLPNRDIDTATIEVSIQSTSSDLVANKYVLAESVLELSSTDRVYYLKELEDRTYELSFGRNNLGAPIQPGNVITVSYLVTNKTLGDGASLFVYSGQSLGGVTTVETVNPSTGGAEPESLEDIRYNVTRSFYNQNRAVTSEDYTSLLKRLYPDIKSIAVWGGEFNDPPVYGKVFICIRPNSKAFLTPIDKSYITEILLKSRNTVSITPEIVDPKYIELSIDSTVYYNPSKTTKNASQINALVSQAIKDYRDQNLNEFGGAFRLSKLSAKIDAIDSSIVSNITKILAYIDVIPKYLTVAEYRVNFNNPIYRSSAGGSVETSGFTIDSTNTVYYLKDDGFENMYLFSVNQETKEEVVKNSKIGSINYETGEIRIRSLYITNLDESNFYFKIKTSSYDVIPVRDQLIDIPNVRIKVNAIEDKVARGITASNSNYTFTSSRS